MQSRSGNPGLITRYLITQSSFDAWANNTKARNVSLLGLLLIFIAIACSAAIVVLGPRLVREGTLLWFGTRADGVLKSADVIEVGKFKGGDPKYRLTMKYDFTAADGARYDGVTERGDVRTPPDLKPGDTIGVYYDRANPQNSVAEHNLRSDVYGILLFLPWIAIFGIAGPLFYLARWRHWRQTLPAGHT